MLAVKAQNLSKTYKTKKDTIEAVKDVSFRVEQGEIFAILGPNGAGKSSVILMLTTLLKPSGGLAEILGLSVIGNESLVRENIGVALQETGIDENLTAKELLNSTARLWGLNKQESVKRSDDLLRLVGLFKDSNRKVKTYSGGMKRRLDLALSLVHEPKVLFLDEPTTGLDPGSRRVLWKEIARLKNSGVAIILTTQYLDEADELADRIAIVHEGRVVQEGTPNELKASVGGDVVTFTFPNREMTHKATKLTPDAEMFENELRITVPNGPEFIPEAFVLFRNAGIDISAVSASKPTLDDVFLSFTGFMLGKVDDKN